MYPVHILEQIINWTRNNQLLFTNRGSVGDIDCFLVYLNKDAEVVPTSWIHPLSPNEAYQYHYALYMEIGEAYLDTDVEGLAKQYQDALTVMVCNEATFEQIMKSNRLIRELISNPSECRFKGIPI